jgi:hypothetical protein
LAVGVKDKMDASPGRDKMARASDFTSEIGWITKWNLAGVAFLKCRRPLSLAVAASRSQFGLPLLSATLKRIA